MFNNKSKSPYSWWNSAAQMLDVVQTYGYVRRLHNQGRTNNRN